METHPLDHAAFDVPELCCSEEMTLVQRGLARVAGVENSRPDYVHRTLHVEFHSDQTTPEAIARAIESAGFVVRPHRPARLEASKTAWRWRGTTAAGGMLLLGGAAASFFFDAASPAVAALLIASTIASGVPVFRVAARAIWLWALDMNVLMSMAALGAIAIGQYFEAATAMFLFAVSLWLESHSMDRTRRAVAGLLELSPTVAHRIDGHEMVDVEPAALAVGDRVLVRPGERVPVDGVVLAGNSSVNQSPITGESIPVEKSAGQPVFAGSLNGEGSLQIETQHAADASTLAHIAQLVADAESRRSPTERFIDRFARHYTPVVIGLAAIFAITPPILAQLGVGWAGATPAAEWFRRGLVLLVIACPCALVISTPVAIVCGLFQASRRGILIKGGEFLESAGLIDAIALDKTGTLSTGDPRVVDVVPFPGTTGGTPAPKPQPRHEKNAPGAQESAADQILRVAATLESHSEHPLAEAIVREARRRGLPFGRVDDFHPLRGFGVEGAVDGRRVRVGSPALFGEPRIPTEPVDDGDLPTSPSHEACTLVLVGTQQQPWGMIRLADPPRSDARQAVWSLRRAGIRRLVMLTGDSRAVADAMGRELGLDETLAQLSPEEKVRQVETLAARYPRLAMVGDGVNDAPALAAAPLGIALGRQASDTALSAADVVILTPALGRLAELILLGRRCRRILRQNIIAALGIKAAVLVLAALGAATLWMAVFADVGASLLVTSNSLRLIDRRLRQPTCNHPQAPSTSLVSPLPPGEG